MSVSEPSTLLALLPRATSASVTAIDWHLLSDNEARRLREFGLDDGVEVELLQPSGLLRGPLSVRIGRMTIAIRHHVAGAIHVTAKPRPAKAAA
jgi:ferrous iron transport protein A